MNNEILEIAKLLSDLFKVITTLDTAMLGVVVTVVEKVFTRERVVKSSPNIVFLVACLLSFIFSLVFSLIALVSIPKSLSDRLRGVTVEEWFTAYSFNGSIYLFIFGVVFFFFLAMNVLSNSKLDLLFSRLKTKIFRMLRMKSFLSIFVLLSTLAAFLSGCISAATPYPIDTPTSTVTATATITFTPTLTLTPSPTFTPSPIPTATRIPPPTSYSILYDFDGSDIDPVFQQEIPENCTPDQRNGILYIECSSNPNKDTYLRYIPRVNEAFQGVAMLAHVDAPYDETWGRISPMVHFIEPGNPDTRSYTMALRKGIVKVVEYYPAKNFEFKVLGEKAIPEGKQSDFHLVQIEFKNGSVEFFFDGVPIVLEIQPNLPQGYMWDSWKFELVLFQRSPDDSKTLISQIDWFAVRR